jgi:hypothetical protein
MKRARGAVSRSALFMFMVTSLHVAAAAQWAPSQPAATVDGLGAIVGRWQSDVVDGRSVLSDCVWTPQRAAVLCEQTITASSGVRHVLNLFTFDAATSHYFLYVVPNPGASSAPVSIAIQGARWFYGGGLVAAGQRRVRTINDFSERDSYDWWTESSDDGEHWTRVTGGRSTRVTPH